jgi:hypothetical protein
MPTVNVSSFEGRPLLDLRSFGRRGPGRRDYLSPAEIAQISRTVRRVPEVVVKVLPRSSNNLSAIGRHLDYIGRKGELELESDDEERLNGKNNFCQTLHDWDLDLDEHRRTSELYSARGRSPPKLVHKLMLSMPPGTPSDRVLAAAKNFLREEFALKHRYAFVLHTDEPHPHVHAVVKAVSEQGVRLNIRRATLRHWRSEFARHLRAVGVEANASERAVRGESRKSKKDGIYRAGLRGASTYVRRQVEEMASGLLDRAIAKEPGRAKIVETRRVVEVGWQSVSELLSRQKNSALAADVARFVERMRPAATEREFITAELLRKSRNPDRGMAR